MVPSSNRDSNIDITVSIVSYNSRDELLACLHSLHLEDKNSNHKLEIEIIVTDNASSDGSLESVRRNFPEVIVIEAGGNLGYGRANNLAFEKARGRYFLILNSDTEVPPGALRSLRDFLDTHPEACAVGAQLVSYTGEMQPSAGSDPNLSNLLLQQFSVGRTTTATVKPKTTTPLSVDWICGGCLCVRSEAYVRVGGFDPVYFMYLEDCDLCLRLRQQCGKLVLLPAVRVLHHLGASSRPDAIRAKMVIAHNESCWHYFRRHRGTMQAHLVKIICLLGVTLRLISWSLLSIIRPGTRVKVRLFWQILCGTLAIGRSKQPTS